MNTLQLLRQKNPGLPLYDVHDPSFAPYGRVLPFADAALSGALRQTPIPAEGNRYVASDPALESLAPLRDVCRTVYGEMPVQVGFCNGRGDTLNAEEYHKCSELNYSTTGAVLLLALPTDLSDRTLDVGRIVGFYLPPETLIEVHPRVLHFAPCRTEESGFNCLVALTRGTNAPLSKVDPTAPGEAGLLWMTNKWLLCHPDSPQAAKGAFVGITGENIDIAGLLK